MLTAMLTKFELIDRAGEVKYIVKSHDLTYFLSNASVFLLYCGNLI